MYNSGIKQEVKYNVDTKQKVINDLNRYCSSSLNIFSLLPTKSLYQKRFEYYYNNGMLNQVLQDFINERRIFSDCMIVGQYCLIGRNSQFIFYREILSITFNRNFIMTCRLHGRQSIKTLPITARLKQLKYGWSRQRAKP